MDLSILIVSWNTCDLLDQCLKSIYETTKGIEYEVIVVDNASSDSSVDMVKRKYPQVKLISNTDNVGFARANNHAYEISSAEFVMLLNPDTVVLDGSINRMLDVLKANDDCATVAPKLLWNDRTVQPSIGEFPTLTHELIDALCLTRFTGKRHSSRFYVPNDNRLHDIAWACGACLLIRRGALRSASKILDERYFMFSEETDLCKTVRMDGWRVCYEPNAAIVHLGSGSTSKVQKEMLARLYESKFLYFEKHHDTLYADVYRFIVLPIHLMVRLAGFLPGLVLKKSEYTRQQTHPASQIYVLKKLVSWNGSDKVG